MWFKCLSWADHEMQLSLFPGTLAHELHMKSAVSMTVPWPAVLLVTLGLFWLENMACL